MPHTTTKSMIKPFHLGPPLTATENGHQTSQSKRPVEDEMQQTSSKTKPIIHHAIAIELPIDQRFKLDVKKRFGDNHDLLHSLEEQAWKSLVINNSHYVILDTSKLFDPNLSHLLLQHIFQENSPIHISMFKILHARDEDEANHHSHIEIHNVMSPWHEFTSSIMKKITMNNSNSTSPGYSPKGNFSKMIASPHSNNTNWHTDDVSIVSTITAYGPSTLFVKDRENRKISGGRKPAEKDICAPPQGYTLMFYGLRGGPGGSIYHSAPETPDFRLGGIEFKA